MFGGWSPSKRFDIIREYDTITNTWCVLDCKIPAALSSFGCASTFNGQYVVLFGGYDGSWDKDDILIYSVRDNTFRDSRIKCPKIGHYQALAVNDRKQDEIITFGYIRNKWREYEINDNPFPPHYLIKIICAYFWNEWIHLFDNSGDHFKIDVLKLFDF